LLRKRMVVPKKMLWHLGMPRKSQQLAPHNVLRINE
jgi:hypothetical protein